MCVAGPAVLLFVTVIARTSRTNGAGVWIVRPTHAKNIRNNFIAFADRWGQYYEYCIERVFARSIVFNCSVYSAIYSNPR